jgi:hypothetical protein
MPPGGPYVRAAFLCERLLTEKDDVLTAVRLVDKFWTEFPADADDIGLPTIVNATMLVSFVAGDVHGDHVASVRALSPSGQAVGGGFPSDIPLNFPQRADAVLNLIFQLHLSMKDAGVYWFEVSLDGEVVTRVPMRIVRAATQEQKSEPESEKTR